MRFEFLEVIYYQVIGKGQEAIATNRPFKCELTLFYPRDFEHNYFCDLSLIFHQNVLTFKKAEVKSLRSSHTARSIDLK